MLVELFGKHETFVSTWSIRGMWSNFLNFLPLWIIVTEAPIITVSIKCKFLRVKQILVKQYLFTITLTFGNISSWTKIVLVPSWEKGNECGCKNITSITFVVWSFWCALFIPKNYQVYFEFILNKNEEISNVFRYKRLLAFTAFWLDKLQYIWMKCCQLDEVLSILIIEH